MGIITVNGVIAPETLGMTMPHEHIFCDYSKDYVEPPAWVRSFMAEQGFDLEHGVTLRNYGLLMREPLWSIDNQILSDYDDAKEELALLKRAGVKAVIDPTNIGVGRNPAALRRLGQELDMHFITATGYYRNFFHPAEVENMTVADIEARMLEEITQGIAGTDGVRAGLIGELGTTGGQIYPRERRVLIAGGRVQRQTGAPVFVHTEGQRDTVMEALNILEENGADLEKVCICHVNGAKFWRQVVDTGAYVGMDCFGSTFNVDSQLIILESDLERICDLKQVLDAGFAHKVIIGNDVCMKMRLHKYGGWGYDHLVTNLVPYMKKEGITAEQLQLLFSENPRRFLDIAALAA
jgi:phosphotriesterase-related protein